MRVRFTPWFCAALLLAAAWPLRLAGADARSSLPTLPTSPNELGRLVVKGYSGRDHLYRTQSWDIVQDATGVLYFGNNPGVITFDGATWREIQIAGSTTSCRALAIAPDGTIYVGGTNVFGTIRPLGDGRHAFTSLVDRLPENERDFKNIYRLRAIGDALYIEASDRVMVWRGGRFSVLATGSRGSVFSVGKAIYLQTDKVPLHRIDGGAALISRDDPVLRGAAVRWVGLAPDGALRLVTTGGLFNVDRDGRAIPWTTGAAAYLREKEIWDAWQLPDGTLAIARKAGGLAFVGADGALIACLDESNGLRNGNITCLAPDRDGGFWLSLSSGMARVSWPPAITFFDQADGLSANVINDICRHQGALYVASRAGVHRLAPSAEPGKTGKFELVVEGSFFSLNSSGLGLLAGESKGLYELTPAGFERVFPLASTGYTILPSRREPDLVWLGQGAALRAVRKTPSGWRDEGRVPGISDIVRSLAEMPDGRIWASINGKGVVRFTPDTTAGKSPATGAKVERFPEAPGEGLLWRVARWGDDIIFTRNGAKTLFHYDETAKRFVPLPGVDPLPENRAIGREVFGADNPAALWVSPTYRTIENKRIVRLARGGGVQVLPQSVHDIVTNPSQFYDEPGPDGRRVVWIGGEGALLRVDVDRAFPPVVPYQAAVWSAQRDLRDGDRLPFGRAEFNFDFVAPRWSPGTALKYQTRLTGDSDAWSEWSPKRQRTFTHLSEGSYRFEVQARDADGHLSKSATLAFTILPPWWRTWWAYGCYGLGFVGVVAGAVRLRTRALQRKNEQLERIVATRTDDLRRQNGELARLHKLELDEKISARLAAEKAQLDVLRYQLNPHFLFNSLTSIRSQIPPALGSARDTLDRLADFCRLTLTGRKAEERTTVGEEIAMLRAYLDIEQTRMGELLSVDFDIDHALDGVMMPRLLLLPLVENALKYGQATSEDTLGLKISAQRGAGDTDAVVFTVSNTGTWVERGSRPGIPSTGIGHENLRERLRRHYPEAHAFAHSTTDGWVHVRLELRSPSRSS